MDLLQSGADSLRGTFPFRHRYFAIVFVFIRGSWSLVGRRGRLGKNDTFLSLKETL